MSTMVCFLDYVHQIHMLFKFIRFLIKVNHSIFPFLPGMQQTVVEYIDAQGQENVREEIFNLLGLTHSQRQHLTSPHKQSLSGAENHTVLHFFSTSE